MTWMAAAFVAGGLALLLGGGECLVRGAVGLARSLGVPPLVIGLTVVAFGTSAPELVVSLQAALGGHPDIVLGNVVGSNNANVLLIAGAAAAIRPVAAEPGAVRRDGAALMAATLAFIGLCLLGELGFGAGLALAAALAAWMALALRSARRRGSEGEGEIEDEIEAAPRGTAPVLLLTLAGIAGVLLGARLLIDGAVDVARAAGLSEAVIGLTLIAFGTSLPELAAAGMAALRGHGDIALGNVMGSNLFNMLGIAGVTAMAAPVPVPAELLRLDLWVMLAATLLLLAAMRGGRRIGRLEGGALAGAYALYIGVVVGA